MSAIVKEAERFATEYHRGQVRKYTGDPYIVHPAAVVSIVQSVPHTDEMLCSAWLHDVVEDTECTMSGIVYTFGKNVASLVEMLTDVSKPEDGNRFARKAIDREHTAKSSPEAKTIKLADLIDNSRSILAYDAGFAKIYLAEKRQLLDVLTEGDSNLWNLENSICANSHKHQSRPILLNDVLEILSGEPRQITAQEGWRKNAQPELSGD